MSNQIENDVEARLAKLEELGKYLIQDVDRINGMVQMMIANIETIKQRTQAEEIRKVAHS